jgi:uncharacterized coiled-coil protein SlyX
MPPYHPADQLRDTRLLMMETRLRDLERKFDELQQLVTEIRLILAKPTKTEI